MTEQLVILCILW